MTCKIAGCTGEVYRAHLCLACYDYWKIHGTLPKRASERPAVEAPPDYEALLAAEQHKTTLARDKAQDYKEQRDRLQAEVERLQRQIEIHQSADDVVDAALALPDVVKSLDLRRALSKYRKVQ